MMERLLAFRPPRIAQLLCLVAVAVHLATPLRFHVVFASVALAAPVIAAGLLIMLRAWWLFRRADTAICPTATATQLITADIYRYTRNPMYLGIVLIMAGMALSVGSLPLYLAAAAWFLIIDRAFIPYEENKLAVTFGQGYRRYLARVRRWL